MTRAAIRRLKGRLRRFVRNDFGDDGPTLIADASAAWATIDRWFEAELRRKARR